MWNRYHGIFFYWVFQSFALCNILCVSLRPQFECVWLVGCVKYESRWKFNAFCNHRCFNRCRPHLGVCLPVSAVVVVRFFFLQSLELSFFSHSRFHLTLQIFIAREWLHVDWSMWPLDVLWKTFWTSNGVEKQGISFAWTNKKIWKIICRLEN